MKKMRLWMKISCSIVKILLGLSVLWASVVTWDVLHSIENQIALVAQSTVSNTDRSDGLLIHATENSTTPLLQWNVSNSPAPLPTSENVTTLPLHSSTLSDTDNDSSSSLNSIENQTSPASQPAFSNTDDELDALPSNMESYTPPPSRITLSNIDTESDESPFNIEDSTTPPSQLSLSNTDDESDALIQHNATTGRKKNHLVIHIGPEKTASTTLQKDFYYKFDLKGAFAADNYIYMGRYTFLRGLQDVLLYCPAKMKTRPKDPCYYRFLRLVDDARWQGKNIVLSEEVYSKAIWDLKTVAIVQKHFLPLLQKRWDISVVAVYRRFHEWLVSARKQRDVELPERQLWPQEGGEALDSWKEIMLLRKQERFGLRSHYLPDDLAQWQDLNVSVNVLNMHHPTKKITEQFVCDVLPNATKTCEYFRSNGRNRHANIKSGLEYFFDNIVYAAAAKGILDTTNVQRAIFVKDLTKKYATIPNVPLICPSSEDLEQLLQESVHWEQYYAPDHADLDAVKASFDKLVRSNQFCRVDTDRMFEGVSQWSEVLHQLGDPVTASE